MQRQPLREDAVGGEARANDVVVVARVERPALAGRRVRGIRGDHVVGLTREPQIVAPVVADQPPIRAIRRVVVLLCEQVHRIAHLRHQLDRLHRGRVLQHRTERDTRADLRALRQGGMSWQAVADDLNSRGILTKTGRRWTWQTTRKIAA